MRSIRRSEAGAAAADNPKDMHTLKEDAEEVVQGHDEGVCPLSREVGGKGGVGVWGWQEGEDKPILPLGLVLEFRGLLREELLGLVVSVRLEGKDRDPAVRRLSLWSSCLPGGWPSRTYKLHNRKEYHPLSHVKAVFICS